LSERPPFSPSASEGWVVGLDVTGDLGSVALVREGTAAITRAFAPGNRHSANLLPAIEGVLEEAGIGIREVSLLATARGPGSFTGLRVGLATAQGLGLATGIPAVGVSSLDAAAATDRNASGRVRSGSRLVLLDALRGELFGAVYSEDEDDDETPTPFRTRPEEVSRLARERGVRRICGPGVARYEHLLLRDTDEIERDAARYPLAEAVTEIGWKRYSRGAAEPLEPLYLREPDAVPKPPGSFR